MRRARGIRHDKTRRLVQAAIEQGWRTAMDGNGHLRLTRRGRLFVVSTTIGDDARAYMNLRAAARRAGLDTEGL